MVQKIKRDFYNDDRYDLIITDKLGNIFKMTVGGNGDLYWIPQNKNSTTFYINKEDSLLYKGFTKLFKLIEQRDNRQSPSLINNVFTFVSEDRHIDDANILKITKAENEFIFNFIKTDVKNFGSTPNRFPIICFCNSGSRIPQIEQLFQIMFNELAYYVKDIEEIENKNPQI